MAEVVWASLQGFKPTQETVKKLRVDILYRIAKHLSHEQRLAAEEIRSVSELFSLSLSSPAYDGGVSGGDPSGYLHPFHRMKTQTQHAYERRYRPWAAEMATIDAWPGFSLFRLCKEIILDNQTTWQIEDTHGIRHGKALVSLTRALERYARIAGWV